MIHFKLRKYKKTKKGERLCDIEAVHDILYLKRSPKNTFKNLNEKLN